MKLVANRKRALVLCAFVMIAYFGGYVCSRAIGELIHYENKSEPIKGHEIKAPDDAWSGILSEMAKDSTSTIFKAYAVKQEHKLGVLDFVYYPLRKCEAGVWNVVKNNG